jgi:hypothetical protein
MIISVFSEECDLDECDDNEWGWILVYDH